MCVTPSDRTITVKQFFIQICVHVGTELSQLVKSSSDKIIQEFFDERGNRVGKFSSMLLDNTNK